ncbi:hypothetical protein BH24ACT5_BH24ACT5_18290 [soil metagenome]
MTAPIDRRAALRLVAAGVGAIVLAGCSSSDEGGNGDPTADTVSPFGGTVPPGGPAIDLNPTGVAAVRIVAMVGDSITAGSEPGLDAMAADLGIDLTVNAEVGRRITVGRTPPSGVSAVEGLMEGGLAPDLWVIALGTNDLGKYGSTSEYGDLIEALLDLLPSGVPLVWINTYITSDPDDAATFNEALIDTLSARGRATIGRWASVAFEDGVLSDGIHPTEEGQTEFVAVVRKQLLSWMN